MASKLIFALCVSALALSACSDKAAQTSGSGEASGAAELSIPFEKYTLDNGLEVILHVDKSDPVVAINLAAHVGSSRETEGRTGFAHLFEHLLFLDSENLGYGGLDEMNTRIGGEGTNGFTTHDMTQYFQAVPADALEKVVWAEADKLGWFIKTVSQNVVDNEKQVVKNEKRQRVDNQPGGHNFYIINKALYPENHPYNWQVIGSLADLDAATLQDVKDFYGRWYVPNNVTVTISGDFDTSEAKDYVEKYFGEIPEGPAIAPRKPWAAKLEASQNLYHEDNFATVPTLTMVWPAVEQYHPDSNALNVLAQYLTIGKRAPLNEVLIDEQKLTSSVSAFYYGKELAGEFYISVDANAGEDIDGLVPALSTAFARFEETGISDADLSRIKAGLEVSFYSNVESALGKAIQLGEYNLFTGDPGYITTDLNNLMAVTPADVRRVYDKYIKDQNLVYTSFVPKGELTLKLDDVMTPVKANVVEEVVVEGEGAPVDFDPAARVIDEPTLSSFDRKIEPDFGKSYTLSVPKVDRSEMGEGLQVLSLMSDETPLVSFNLMIPAGRDKGNPDKPAIANLTADILEKGTANKTTAELEDAIKSLGSSLSIYGTTYATYVSGTTLARNLDATVALLEEMLLEPRWDAEEFELLKRKQINTLDQAAGNPNAIAARETLKLRYPEGHVFRYRAYGTKEKLEAVTLGDLKAFYAANYVPQGASLAVVGAADQSAIEDAFSGLAGRWSGESVPAKSWPQTDAVEKSVVYFYDIPEAKQSVIRMSRPSLSASDPDLAAAEAMNFLLGGIYTSKLNTELRVNKGYTYGIRSSFSAAKDRGTFGVSSSVRTNVTLESLKLIKDIVGSYGPDFTEEDLATMKDALLRGQALETETLSAKQSMLDNIAAYGYASDYKAKNAKVIKDMTLEQFKALASEHLRPDAMTYLVVGDAKTQAARLSELGFGDPVMLETE